MYWGEIGPDANEDGKDRGPRGYDELNQAKAPGFFGWPYFIGDNKPYNDYNFATSVSGPLHDPSNPINDSPNNTGRRDLPPAQKAMIWYPYGESEEFPLVGSGGRNAMAGPAYHADQFTHNPNRFPDYYDDKLFIYDWMRGWMMAVSFDESGNMTSMEPFMPSTKWNNLMDVVLGPDGDFYTIEYGTGWFTANENAILSHIKYIAGNRVPTASFEVNQTAKSVPFAVQFDASQSIDSDDDQLTYSWDFGDGNSGKGQNIEHTYTEPGSYTAELTVSDGAGGSATDQVKILAGNTPPEVKIALQGNNNFYFSGGPVNYRVTATDEEDGEIDPSDITLTVDYLEQGHDMTSIAQGHMALSQIKSAHPGQDLIAGSDCVSCHKVDGTSVGPSYKEISLRYLTQKGRKSRKIDYLAEKIINGGGGVWGETAMAAHPNIPAKDAAQMAAYILSVGEEKETIDLPASGTYSFSIPEGKQPGGRFILTASYTDKGSGEVEPLRSFDNIVLRSSLLPSTEFSSAEKASKFTISPDMVPGVDREFDIVIISDGAIISYNDLDLTDISGVVMVASAPAMFTVGGSYEIYLDNTDGDPIATGEIKTGMNMQEPDNYIIPLEGVSGKHSLIATFKANKEGSPVGSLMAWSFMDGSIPL